MIKEVTRRIKHPTNHFSVLEDVLDTLRFRGNIFFRSQLASPWGISLSALKNPRFHISLKGNFVVGVDASPNSVSVNEMGIVLLPHGDMHWIADAKESARVDDTETEKLCALGNPLFQKGDITNKVMCGLVYFDDDILHPILDSLPSVLNFGNIKKNDPIWMTVLLLEAETAKIQDNRSTIVDRLSEVLFLQLLHKFVEESPEVTGFLAALQDQRVHHVLQLIHQQPGFRWTLELLGDKVGMSRATLVRQFNSAIGVPPMTYINQWRMMKAHHLLKHSTRSVEHVAESVGFSSSRTLNKAFQRQFGFTPKELRRKLNET